MVMIQSCLYQLIKQIHLKLSHTSQFIRSRGLILHPHAIVMKTLFLQVFPGIDVAQVEKEGFAKEGFYTP